MKKKIKTILLVWPLIGLLGTWGYFSIQRQQIDTKLMDANGLVWKSADALLVAQVNQREEGERLHIKIKITNAEKTTVYEKLEEIDRDMFGGGFVRAAQVDEDSENEIVVWHAHAKYYLDFSNGSVQVIPFDQIPQQVKDLAERWHRYNVMAGVEMTIMLIFVFSYYVLYLLIKGLIGLVRIGLK